VPGSKAAKGSHMLLVEADVVDDCKLKPLFVRHSENSYVFKGLSKATLSVHFHSNPKPWMAVVLSEDWFMNYFIPKVKKFCRVINILFKILLIVSNAPGHPVRLGGIHANAQVVFLLQNTTSVLQPIDQGPFTNLKDDFLQRTFAQAVETIETLAKLHMVFGNDVSLPNHSEHC
jgi:hypothetical protein